MLYLMCFRWTSFSAGRREYSPVSIQKVQRYHDIHEEGAKGYRQQLVVESIEEAVAKTSSK
jgi:hypothetical protein